MDQLSDQQRDDLLRYGFDEELQRRWQRDVSDGRLSKTTNAVSGDLLAPPPGTVHTHFAQLATLPAAVQQRITLMHHTEVPPGTDLLSFQGAAARHQTFAL